MDKPMKYRITFAGKNSYYTELSDAMKVASAIFGHTGIIVSIVQERGS